MFPTSSRPRSYSSSSGGGPVHKSILDLVRGQRSNSIPNAFGSSSAFHENINTIYVRFFSKYRCYDLIPISAKLIIFDTQLIVKKAFNALLNNGCRAAPLWDTVSQKFVGMLSVTDLIQIMRTYHKSPTIRLEDVEDQKIEVWRNLLNQENRPLVSIGPDDCLLDAIKTLNKNKVHRLPIIDPETELPQPSFLFRTLNELRIGTYDNITTITRNTLVITALDRFMEKRISALPVIDEETGKVIDIFAKHDVVQMAAEKSFKNLSLTVGKALERQNTWFEGVIKCKLDDTLGTVIQRIVKADVHRIIVVDEDDRPIGIVSLSDILTFLSERQQNEAEQKRSHNLEEEPSDGDVIEEQG